MADTCVFCDIVAGDAPPPKHFLSLGRDAVVFEPLNPVTPGHLLVVPTLHIRDVTENPDVAGRLMRAAAVLASKFSAANLITSIGEAATQSVFHAHLHLVPRYEGDGLHLPWTGQGGDR